jgi:hypothetical protein
MDGNNLGYHVSLRRVRKAIQLQQDHAMNPQSLANDELAKIAVFRDQDAALGIRRLENVLNLEVPISFRGWTSRRNRRLEAAR